MTRSVLLLRGLNVGTANRIRMPELVAVVEQAGGRDVSTYVQSGNVLCDADDPLALAQELERRLAERGVRSPVVVRTRVDLDDVVAGDPFAGRDLDPKLVHVAFCAEAPDTSGVDHDALLPEELVARGRELYLWYAGGVQRSRLERVTRGLGVVMTARNWRTVTALRDLL